MSTITHTNHPNAAHSKDLTFDNPGYTLIFFMVDRNGEDFRYINNIDVAHDFRWDRWKEYKKDLKPYSIHCFLMKLYQAKSGTTGNGFWPERRVCGFTNLEEARACNKSYLDLWQLWNTEGTAEETRDLTLKYIDRLQTWAKIREDHQAQIIEATKDLLDPMSASMMQWAFDAQKMSEPELEELESDDFFLEPHLAIAELAEDYKVYSKKLFDSLEGQIEWIEFPETERF
jgi:hypothetical protein